MVINDFIKPRQEIITSDYQFNLNFADINSVDRLESSPEDFCAKTYPSQSLNRLIQIINDKIIGSSDLGSVVLTGAQGAGKTHALLMAYNLFANPDAIKNWLIEHKIKFNKFNLAIIKNQSKYCTVKAKDLADKNLWEVIFNKLGAQDLLKRVKEYPERKIIKKLINREYTAVVIDELEAYFSQLKENNNDLVESSKEFLKNLLDVAAENNNLFVFSSIKGEEYELLELVESSNAQLLNLSEFEEESEIINYRLFSSINKNVHRNEINKIIEEYINIYQEQKINIVRKEELAETLISTYPFHCDLMKLLKQQSQTQKLFILADIIGKYYDQQELLLVENIELDSLSSLNSEIYSSVQEIKKNLGEHNWDYFDEILTVLAAYNILQEHPVEKREILRGVITLANDNIDEIEKTLNHIVDESNNVIFTASGYKIKAKHDAVADWRSEIKKISQKSAKEELAAYIKENFFTTQYKVFGVDKIIDKQELTPILLLDHIAKENLSSFLENELYDSRKYENTIAVIIPKKNIITDDNLKDIKKLIAGQKLNLENSELKKIENGAEVAEEIKAANNRLQQDLKSSFGYYLDWKEEKGDYRLIKKEFNSEDFDIEVVAANNKKIKEYILKQAKKSKSGLEIEKLLHQLQVVRSNPVIASKEQFLAIVDELTAQGELIADNSTARLYKSKEELISFRADEIEDQQAAEEMVNYLKEEILPSYYKVYGWDELSDTEELEYVIFIDLPDKKEAKKDVINQLEADLKFDNTLVRIAANTNLLETEIMMTVKKILVAQSLTEEDFSELLATKKEKLITTLKSQFGSYLTWENKRNPDLNIKEISDISEIEDLVQTEKQALGNYILELLEAKKVIDIDELLVELKIDKSKVFIADDNDYYQLLRTLEERKELFLIEENNKIYIDSSKLLEGYTSSLSETELKEEFVKYVREKFFNDDYKIYGYDKIEDKPLIQSVLLFATPKETNKLETFIEDKLLCDFEYQNILLLLSPKKNIFKNDSFEYFRDLLAFTNLKSKVKKGKIERLIKDKEKKLMEKLNALQWEYIHWGQDGNRISLERQEVELKDLTSTIKVNKEQIKKYILKRVNEENKIASKKILLEMKKDKSNPFVYSNQLFNNLLEELRDNKKLFATTGIDIIYKDFITYIKDISKEFDKDKMKEKMIKYIKDNLFDFQFEVYDYRELEDSFEFKTVLILDRPSNKKDLIEFLNNKIYESLEYENSVLIIIPKENILTTKYLKKLKEVLTVEELIDELEGRDSELLEILEEEENLQQELAAALGVYLQWNESDKNLELELKEFDLEEFDLKQIASGEEKLQNYILKQIKIAPLTVDELLQKCKKDRRHPLIVEENIFYKVVERLIAAEEVYKVGEKNKLSLDLINNQQQELDEYTINEEDDLSLDTDSEATNDFLDKEEDIEEIADEEEEEVLDDLDIGIGEHFLNIESEDQKTLEECPNCGFELAGDEKMCPRCGIELY